MLKMKIMTFFKNPVVRDIFIVLTAVIIVASIISIPVSNAGSQINVAFRAASMGVSAGTKDVQIPEISPDQSGDKKSKYRNVFCIQEGNNLSYGVYTNEYNAYNSAESSQYFKNYGSALWLIDNMYIADSTNSSIGLDYLVELVTSPDVAKTVNQYGNVTTDAIKALNKMVGGKKDSKGNVMNKNFIEVIEQLVLWNYTNNTSGINPDTLVNGGFSGTNISDSDQNAAKYLYYALRKLSENNASYTSNGTVSNVISFDTSKATIDTSKAQVGPYSLKSNGITINIDNTLKSKISAIVTKSDGSTQTLDASKIIINDDGTFYIDVKDCGQITKSQINIDAIYTGCTTTVEVMVNGKNQNIINIRKTYNTKPLSDEKTISYSGKYSVKLIKTKIDGSTAITENPATFTISGAVNKKGEKTGNDGVLLIADERKIEDVSATETYTIVEDFAPKGYTKYDGTITLNVGFKADGTNYLLDKEKIKMSADGKVGTVKVNVPNDNTIEIYVPNGEDVKKGPKFDLSLRKFITKIDGKEVEVSRVPVIDKESKTVLDLTGTAVYHHTKQSLKVNIGSEVEYTIRVYNEGDVEGIAKEITDYLPEGLSFVKIADESAQLYTTDAKEGSKEVVLKYTGSEVIGANSIERILKNDIKNAYQEVKFICKVNERANGYITNRSEITIYGYTDSNGEWHEAKAIGNSDRDSVEKTISSSLGLDTWYENAKTYTYTVDGNQKEVKDYYPGVQDDDDFETVEVESIKGQFKVVLKKVDLANKNQGLSGAYFTLKNGEKVGPTDENGYVELIKEEKITEASQKFSYTFEETTAPAGYDRYDKKITLNVATKTVDGGYVVDVENTKLAESNERVSMDATTSVITIEIRDEKTASNFDLALRKFITNIDGKEITSRIPQVTLTDDFKSGKVTTAKYEHTKDPLEVATDNVVTYTIRVYNEGAVDGYATKVMDDIPEGLEFLPEDETNKANGWKMYQLVSEKYHPEQYGIEIITYGKNTYVVTEDATKADLIITDALKDQLIKAYNAETSKELDFKDIKVAFKVIEPNSSDRIITNYAQITEHKDKEGKTTVTDRDSTPNVWNEGEDDQDIENIKLIDKTFDLALRKFITNVNGKEITSRIPQVTLTDDFKSGKVTTATYEHSKEPVDVVQGNIVVYTIRVYNEGAVDGYATKVMDDIPEGLEFIPEDETNKTNGWKMYQLVSEKYHPEQYGIETFTYGKNTYVVTEDASKADLIITDVLKDKLIKAYDANTMDTLDYKDVKVAFKVVEPNTSDRIIINYAQITEHKDKEGKTTIVDRDSTPNVWNEGEDDQDIEKIRLRYFDLALRKWVTEAIVTENGQTQVTPTGHHAEDNPEAIVKVDLKKSKLSNVSVKFKYSIRVTNEGEIAGYAKEVTDYIPTGLKFVAEDNKGWSTTDNPNIVTTNLLADTLLNPGESAEVTIVLTWINNTNNMGLKTNTAEISKDYNEYGAKDIDSTPNNKVPGEDDIDDAPVMLTIKTGSVIIGYVTLAVVFLSIVGFGVYTIRRRII
ncbi:MAG: DUF11 domain-containing protein [Clostridia bacterium]|nr:DUF11 domain-containing protein [Clostridia bacterium]